MGILGVLGASLTHIPALRLTLCEYRDGGRARSGRWLVSKQRKMTWICESERDHKSELSLALGKAIGRLSAFGLVSFRMDRNHTCLRILPQEEISVEQKYP